MQNVIYLKTAVYIVMMAISLFVSLASLNSANATAFTQVDKAELQAQCHSAVMGTRACYNLSLTAWTSESDSQPNPCYHNGAPYCWVFLRIKDVSNFGWVGVDESIDAVDMKTIGEVREAYIKKNGIPFTVGTVATTYDPFACAAILYAPGSYGVSYIKLTQKPLVYPTSMCALPPPPVGTCKITGDVIIDYGSVSADMLSGARKSGSTSIECNTASTVSFVVFDSKSDQPDGEVSLRSDGSLSAKLTIDGTPASNGKTYDIPENSSVNVTVDSELVVNGTPEAGPFSGSAVAILSMP